MDFNIPALMLNMSGWGGKERLLGATILRLLDYRCEPCPGPPGRLVTSDCRRPRLGVDKGVSGKGPPWGRP